MRWTVTCVGHQLSRFFVSLRSETHAAGRSNTAPQNQFGHRTLFMDLYRGPGFLCGGTCGAKKRIEEFRSECEEKPKLYFLANLIVNLATSISTKMRAVFC